jgi:hypothetical protein
MAIDYQILYRQQISATEIEERSKKWDLFISAFNTSDRVTQVFDHCRAAERHWIAHPEYNFAEEELPEGCFRPESKNEAEFWSEYVELSGVNFGDGLICIDATGFMRPHLAFLMSLLFRAEVGKFLMLYSDPVRYVKQEKTEFTKGPVTQVRQVSSFEGVHLPGTEGNDLVIIGAGYDDELIRRVAEDRANAQKVQMFGLPSLEPDMYQQSVYRAEAAAEAVGAFADVDTLFAPANDPFVTAQVIRNKVEREREKQPIANLYLSSLGTKPQMLGFALYYLTECQGKAASMLFPYAELYAQETTQGLARTWHYTMEPLTG